MKKVFLLWIAILWLNTTHGQTGPGTFLKPVKDQCLCYIELNGQTGMVFSLRQWGNHRIHTSIIFADTLLQQPDTSGYVYAGKHTRLQKEGDKLFLILPGGARRQFFRLEIDTLKNGQWANRNINKGYWYNRFSEIHDPYKTTLPWSYRDIYKALYSWDSFSNTHIYYKDFQTFADNRLIQIRDSVVAEATKRTRFTRSVIDSLATLPMEELKDKFLQLYEYENKDYFEAAAKAVCAHNPEIYLKLAQELPALKKPLFWAVYDEKETVKNLKKQSANSPVTKEFLRRRTAAKIGNVTAVIYGVTGLLVYPALLGWGIYALVK